MEKEHMANITKIKAHDTREKSEKPKDKPVVDSTTQDSKAAHESKATQGSKTTDSKATQTPAKPAKKAARQAKRAEKKAKRAAKHAGKKPFFLFRPFIALGRYIRDSWHELRLVRWPSRKSTWGMVLAVFIYTAIIVLVVTLLDMLFSYLSNLMLG